MENTFVTITGVRNYYGMKPFKVGKIFRIIKEKETNSSGKTKNKIGV